MDIFAYSMIGLGLAMDAAAVSMCKGLAVCQVKTKHCLIAGAYFGIFQGLMPTLGFFAAGTFVHHVGEWANWLAFGVFLLLGATFIRNAWTETPECACRGCNRCVLRRWKNIFAIGIATSIDAFAVGAGIACSRPPSHAGTPLAGEIFIPAVIIAGTTFFCVLAAFHSTRFFRKLPTKLLGTLAGLILIALGIQSLFK